MVTTIQHEHHRLRRAPLNSFFSKRSVVQLEPVIRENIGKLADRLATESQKDGSVIRLDAAFTALTMDVITHYSYGKSYRYLDESDFKLAWKDAVLAASANGAMLRHFPVMLAVSKSMPHWLLKKLDPQAAVLLEIQHMVRAQSVESLQRLQAKKEDNDKTNTATTTNNNTNDNDDDEQAKSIFDALNNPSMLPPQERTLDRLQDEGQILLAAGSETTAKTLTVISLHLLRSPAVLAKLREELKLVMPTPSSTTSWVELEALPYLVCLSNLKYVVQMLMKT
jgi:cytochrome P450